ncbi:MAG TPA: AMP-binding protein [Nocardioidaceae bacterium]|nr:AMP-binding protein [Nocardioidaceae bacterium]
MSALGRVTRHAQNLLEVARYGGLQTGEEPTPYDVVDRGPHHRLRRYDVGLPGDAPAVVLVPPLMVSSEVFDVSPNASAVRTLAAGGVQPWIVDFGSPEHEPGGLERTFEDHVLAVDSAVTFVRRETGRDVHLAGYSQGGMFCYQTAAYRRSRDIASLTTFGSPVDMHASPPFKIPLPVAEVGAKVAGGTISRTAIPGWMTRTGFRALDPVGAVTGRLSFLWALHDREALLPREGQRQFLMRDGWVAFPGPSLEYVLNQFLIHNRMLAGGFEVAGKAVSLADLTVPILTFVGEVDEIAQAPSVRAIRRAAPRAQVFEMSVRTGHFGIVVGSTAMATTWPVVGSWVTWLEGAGEQPAQIVEQETAESVQALERIEHNVGLVAEFAEATGRRIVEATSHPIQRARRLAAPVAQIPRVGRVSSMKASTRESLALEFDRAASKNATTVGFLYEGMVYDYATINYRVDRLVRGLVRRGVRPGDRVGILMHTRPTGLALITAVNRIGAVAVLLRPDGDAAREAKLGRVTLVIADPDHAEHVPPGLPHEVLLLAGGADHPEGVGDLEVRSKDADPLPSWYVRNAGRAGDLAYILFAGSGENTRPVHLTNGRWALTAYGVATSAQLSNKDTVFSVSPMHHPAGLMTAIGGAVVGGARLGMVSDLDPATFWDEARRYGVTVVSYTWTELNRLLDAPRHPAERDHGVRLFLGSGMPRGLWRRVQERFAPARVLEFWASSEGGAIFGNVTGVKVGSVGRPLPGGAIVRLAQFDRDTGELVRDRDGYALPCQAGQLGLLMAQERSGLPSVGASRNVFRKGDSWVPSTSLFRRDADGDYWFEGTVDEIVHTEAGAVLGPPVAAAFEELEQVRSAVAYALPGRDGADVLVVALDLREELPSADLTRLARRLPEPPGIIHVVERMPLSSVGRPLGGAVRQAGIDLGLPAWRHQKGEYRDLTEAALTRLVARS